MRESVIQMGYVTKDLEKSLDYWINVVGAGPFFLADFATENQVYRGSPTDAHVTVAMGYSGDMMIEIVLQNNAAPSAYLEPFQSGRPIPKGGFFHHIMLKHDKYDAIYDKYIAAGGDRCFDAVVPGVGRFCYLDARLMMDCYVELLEVSPMFDAGCRKMHEYHRAWDGTEPRRSYEMLMLELV